MNKQNVLGFISGARSHGDGGTDDPMKKIKEEIAALKETNPDFQKIVDYSIGMGKSEADKKNREQLQKLESEKKSLLEQMKGHESTFQGSQKEKEELQKRIADLEEQTMTAEEKSRKKYQDELKKRDDKLKELENTAVAWQTDYENLLIEKTIMDKVTTGDNVAVNPRQVVDLLKNRAQLKPKIDSDGKELDEFRVVLTGLSKNGDDPSDYDFEEGFKIWADDESNDNLFKSRIAGGGSDKGGSAGHHKPANANLDDVEAYRENRDQILGQIKE